MARSEIEKDPLLKAILEQNIETLRELLAAKIDCNKRPILANSGDEGQESTRPRTYLAIAMETKNQAICEELINAGANLFEPASNCLSTHLMSAVREDLYEVAMFIFKKKDGTVNGHDAAEWTVFHEILNSREVSNIDLFEQFLTSSTMTQKTKDLALCSLYEPNHIDTKKTIELAKTLLDKGANPQKKDELGLTITQNALLIKNYDLAKLLMKHEFKMTALAAIVGGRQYRKPRIAPELWTYIDSEGFLDPSAQDVEKAKGEAIAKELQSRAVFQN